MFRDAVECELAPGLTTRIVPLVVLALLKIVAYLDDPWTRQKDLQDLITFMRSYEQDGDRKFSEDVLYAGVEYEEAGPTCSVGISRHSARRGTRWRRLSVSCNAFAIQTFKYRLRWSGPAQMMITIESHRSRASLLLSRAASVPESVGNGSSSGHRPTPRDYRRFGPGQVGTRHSRKS